MELSAGHPERNEDRTALYIAALEDLVLDLRNAAADTMKGKDAIIAEKDALLTQKEAHLARRACRAT